ncbi:MAG: RAD55 family ATPase [archaeon]
MERESTGIPGMDELIQGGIPKNSVSLVSGSPGTGKSIYSLQFLKEGAENHDQRCLYISFEEEPESIIKQAEGFGWDLKKLQASRKLKIIYNDITKRTLGENETYVSIIKDQIDRYDPERLVIDSLTPLSNLPVSFEELSQYGLATDLTDSHQ